MPCHHGVELVERIESFEAEDIGGNRQQPHSAAINNTAFIVIGRYGAISS